MRSHFNGQGYYLNDDRNSGGKKAEDDILGCGHCTASFKKSEWIEDGCYCSHCDQSIGVKCGCAERMLTRGCENFIMRVERTLERRYVHEQNAKILGTRDSL